MERVIDSLQSGKLRPPTPTTSTSKSPDVTGDTSRDRRQSNSTESTTPARPSIDADDLTPKQSSVADFVRFLDGGAQADSDVDDDSASPTGLRSDHVLAVYQKVERQLGRPVDQRRSDLSRELNKYAEFTSKEIRDPTIPDERFTRWRGLCWTNASVERIAETLVAESDEERIGELAEILETTINSNG